MAAGQAITYRRAMLEEAAAAAQVAERELVLPELLTPAAVVAVVEYQLAALAVAAWSSSEQSTALAQYSLAALRKVWLHQMASTSGR